MGDAQQIQQEDRSRMTLGQGRTLLEKLAVQTALLQREQRVDGVLGRRRLRLSLLGLGTLRGEGGEPGLRVSVVRKPAQHRAVKRLGFGGLALPGERLRPLDRLLDASLHTSLPRPAGGPSFPAVYARAAGGLYMGRRDHEGAASCCTVKSTMISAEMRSSASRS